jgi:hypothetical protein
MGFVENKTDDLLPIIGAPPCVSRLRLAHFDAPPECAYYFQTHPSKNCA